MELERGGFLFGVRAPPGRAEHPPSPHGYVFDTIPPASPVLNALFLSSGRGIREFVREHSTYACARRVGGSGGAPLVPASRFYRLR